LDNQKIAIQQRRFLKKTPF